MYNRRISAAVITAAALAVPASAQAAGYDASVLADSPLSYHRMESSSVATDSSGNGYHGTYVGSALGGTDNGPFLDAGKGVTLTAGGTVSANVTPSSRSAELWLNMNRLRRGEQAGLLAHGDPSADGWAVGVGAKRKLTVVTGGHRIATKVSLPTNTWTMLDVVWTGSKVKVFLNGGTTAKEAPLGAASVPSSSSHQLVVGGTGAGAFTGSFAGKIDEVALFDKELTLTDVQEHHASSKVPVVVTPPVVTVPPQPAPGDTVTVDPGTWTSGTATYQWQRCDANGDDCEDIPGATSPTLTLAPEDSCSTFRVIVTVTNGDGPSSWVSEPSGVVSGTCPDAGTVQPTPGTTSTTNTTNTTNTTTTTTTTTTTGSTATAAKCLKLVGVRGSLKVRGLGRVRLRTAANGCITRTAPLKVSFRKAKGKALRSVKYRLDGTRLRKVAKPTYALSLKPAKVAAGRHVFTVRVTPRDGAARSTKLRLRFAKV